MKRFFLSPLFVGIAVFLFLQLPLLNLDIGFRDEGYLLNNAQRIENGQMPYVDFFLAITPGAYYIQAYVMKMFGDYVITGRILYVLFIVLILILSSKLFKLRSYTDYIFLISLGIIYTGKLSFASYGIEGLFFTLTALWLIDKLRKNNKQYFYAFLIGMTNSITFSFKQTYGVIFFFTLLILIFIYTKREYLKKNISFYLLGSLMLPIALLLIVFFTGSLHELINGLLYNAFSVKIDRMPFIITSLLFIPFFALVFNYIKKFSFQKIILSILFLGIFFILYLGISPGRVNYLQNFYKDFIIYYFMIFFVVPIILINLFFRSNKENERKVLVTSVSALSLFLAQSFSGRDYATVVITAPLYIPLFIYFLGAIYKKIKVPFSNILTSLIIITFIFPSIRYLVITYGKLYGIGYAKEVYVDLDIKEEKYIKVPLNEKKDLESTVNYVKNNTSPNTKLLCFPYCPLMNFLTERDNASYFNFFYKFRVEDQDGVIKELHSNKNIVIVQKTGVIEKEADFEDEKLNVLKKFIQKNYKLDKTTQNFYIYKN